MKSSEPQHPAARGASCNERWGRQPLHRPRNRRIRRPVRLEVVHRKVAWPRAVSLLDMEAPPYLKGKGWSSEEVPNSISLVFPTKGKMEPPMEFQGIMEAPERTRKTWFHMFHLQRKGELPCWSEGETMVCWCLPENHHSKVSYNAGFRPSTVGLLLLETGER